MSHGGLLWLDVFWPNDKISRMENFFIIHTGATYQQVKDSLKKNKIINTDFWFDKVAEYSNYNKNVKTR